MRRTQVLAVGGLPLALGVGMSAGKAIMRQEAPPANSVEDTGSSSSGHLPDDACFEDWTEWGVCSATCWGSGAWQKRSRARLSNATTAAGCTGSMQDIQACNKFVSCPPGVLRSSEDEPQASDGLGCGVGDHVNCPVLEDYPTLDTPGCQGNICCHHRGPGGTIVTSVCPSAEEGWGDGICNYPKQSDCTGGIAGFRMKVERHDVPQPVIDIEHEDPIVEPKITGFDHIHKGPISSSLHISTCKTHICTKGWSPKLGLPENYPCESSPCTEVECCQLIVQAAAPPTTHPCPTNPPVEIPVPVRVEQKVSEKQAVALDLIIGIVAFVFCICGFYCGRLFTRFQLWLAEREQEQEEEAEEQAAKEGTEQKEKLPSTSESSKATGPVSAK